MFDFCIQTCCLTIVSVPSIVCWGSVFAFVLLYVNL